MKAFGLLLLPLTTFAQQSGPANTKGTCSPANTGNNNTFTINCGIDRVQGQQMLRILNRILENQIDPDTVMSKLDEILKGVNEIKEANAPRRISDQQRSILVDFLRNFKGEKVAVEAPMGGDPEAHRYAQDFAAVFKAAGLELCTYSDGSQADGVNPIMRSGPPLTGVVIALRDEAALKKPLVRGFRHVLSIAQIQHSAQRSSPWDPDAIMVVFIGAKPVQ